MLEWSKRTIEKGGGEGGGRRKSQRAQVIDPAKESLR